MPAYRMLVPVEFNAKRNDSGDRENAVISAINNIPGVHVYSDYSEAEEVDTPTQPDEDGQ